MNRTFRRYHRKIALIMLLPLALTVLTGMAYPIFGNWLLQGQVAEIMLKIHSGRILGLDAIYPILNGLGLVGLLITGLNMTSLLRKPRVQPVQQQLEEPESP
ncbi:MAG: peptidase [Coleofasciculus sp. S288]|nr:peptidase [Coleofasciculus sp. S288]